MSKTNGVVPLSPQEAIVFNKLMQSGDRKCTVFYLYWNAKGITAAKASKVPHRAQQQHVGVLIQRINKKRKRFAIVPGGSHDYKLTRRS